MAERPDQHHRLGPPGGAERLPHRGVSSGGVWNAAQYTNKAFDAVIKKYLGAIALTDQRKYAGQIETIMLQDTPVIFPYFYNFIAAGSKR